MKLLIQIMIVFSALSITVLRATDSWITETQLTKVEFYGTQFTIYFDKPHEAGGCGHTGNVAALNTNSEPGKTYYSFFLTAYAAKKPVSLLVSDSTCNGDRPTLKVVRGH